MPDHQRVESKNYILLAEDDLDDQELIASAFIKADPSFRILIVNDGKEALEYLNSSEDSKLPCLIILDYNMPELNGAQVIERIAPNERFKDIPKIILSTSDNKSFIMESMKKGAHDYKVKPDNFQQLVSIAKEMIALCKNAA